MFFLCFFFFFSLSCPLIVSSHSFSSFLILRFLCFIHFCSSSSSFFSSFLTVFQFPFSFQFFSLSKFPLNTNAPFPFLSFFFYFRLDPPRLPLFVLLFSCSFLSSSSLYILFYIIALSSFIIYVFILLFLTRHYTRALLTSLCFNVPFTSVIKHDLSPKSFPVTLYTHGKKDAGKTFEAMTHPGTTLVVFKNIYFIFKNYQIQNPLRKF